MNDPARLKVLTWAAALLVAFITFTLYLPTLKNGFVNWDDNLYIFENQNIRSIDFSFLRWSLSAVVVALWHPLTLFSLAFDYAVWGLNPSGYHLTNIVFHALNTSLVLILSVRLMEFGRGLGTLEDVTKSHKRALLCGVVTATLFGIHPLHVESVAWVSERKDVLSAFFFLLTLHAYLKYTSCEGLKRRIFYGICLFFSMMALLSKPMAVSLPIVLLIIDFYPLKRLISGVDTRITRSLLLEKLPFLLLSILTASLTIWASRSGDAFGATGPHPPGTRLFVSIWAYIFYLKKIIIPLGLAPFYPYPLMIDFFSFKYAGSFILFLLITFLCIWASKRERLFAAVWFYYVATLIPVIGIVQVGLQAAADRYTYLPSLGPFFLLGVGVAKIIEVYSRRKRSQVAIISFLILMSGALASKTVRQIAIWHDSITLWSYEIKLFPDTVLGYYNNGEAYYKSGNHHKAIKQFDQAISINPLFMRAYNYRGNVYSDLEYIRK